MKSGPFLDKINVGTTLGSTKHDSFSLFLSFIRSLSRFYQRESVTLTRHLFAGAVTTDWYPQLYSYPEHWSKKHLSNGIFSYRLYIPSRICFRAPCFARLAILSFSSVKKTRRTQYPPYNGDFREENCWIKSSVKTRNYEDVTSGK